MLKQTILEAVGIAKEAIQDMAMPVKLITRGAATRTPGAAPTYPQVLYNVKLVLAGPKIYDFGQKMVEIPDTRVLATDTMALIFPETGQPVPKPNDLIRVPTGVQFQAGDYRIVINDKVMAGDTVALSVVHLRMT